MIKRILITIVVLFSISCGPRISGTYSDYQGDLTTVVPYVKVDMFDTWLRECDNQSCTHYTTLFVSIHNPQGVKRKVKLVCRYFTGNYLHSIIESKWLLLYPKTSHKVTPVLNRMNMSRMEITKVKPVCTLRFGPVGQ